MAIATNKANNTPEIDDHPAHHNEMATAINTLVAQANATSIATPGLYGAVGIGVNRGPDETPFLGSISSTVNTTKLTMGASPAHDFVQGQRVLVRGAGTTGTSPDGLHRDLTATISTVVGNTITLNTAAGTTVTNAKVFHDDTPAIQAALSANEYVFMAPIPGGYGVNAQWFGDMVALRMPTNRTLQGCGYPGRMVRLDTYTFGNPAAFRLIVNGDFGGNYRLQDLYIDGRLSAVEAVWPTTTLTADWNAIDNIGTTDTIIHGTSFANFPTASSLTVVRPDGVPIQKPYTKTSSTTLAVTLGGGGTAYDTDGEVSNEVIPSGTTITLATRSQAYQCVLFAGDDNAADSLDGFIIDNCTITDWPGTCLRPKNCTHFHVSNNQFRNINRGPCELSNRNTYGTVSDNTFIDVFDDAIAINGNVDLADSDQEAHHIAITGNVLKQMNKTNIYGRVGNTNIKVSGARHVTVANNVLEGGENTSSIIIWDSDSANGEPPPYVAVENIVVANNTIRNSSTNGIHVRSAIGKNIIVTGNIIDSPAWCGICVDPWTPDLPGPNNVLEDITVSNNIIFDAGTDPRAFDSLSKHGIFFNNHGEATNALSRVEVINNKVVRARQHGFFCNLAGNDIHLEGNKFYDCGWLGDADDVISMAGGIVTRFSIKNTTIFNPSTNLGAAKPRYGVNIVNEPPAAWTEGYMSGLIAYNSAAHFSGTVTGTKPAYSDAGTGITTNLTTTHKTA